MIRLALLFLQSLAAPVNLTVSIADGPAPPSFNTCLDGQHEVVYSQIYAPNVTLCFREANCAPDEFETEVWISPGVRSDVSSCVAWPK